MEKKVNLSDYNPATVPDGSDYRIAIVVAEWNPEITDALLQGAYTTLLQHGVRESNIKVLHVPGSYELTTGADIALSDPRCDAAICHPVIQFACLYHGAQVFRRRIDIFLPLRVVSGPLPAI